MNRIRRILNLRPGEGIPAFLLFIYLTLVLTAYIIQKSVRDALFLHQYGAMRLPLLYIAVAVLLGLAVSLYLKLSSRTGQIRLISGTLGLFMANGALLWWAARSDWRWLSIAYYLWANTSGIILTAQVWTLATTIFSIEQARRMFPFICSGGILGSTLGGIIASSGIKTIGMNNLILIPVVLLGGCLLTIQAIGEIYRRSPRGLHARPMTNRAGDRIRKVLRLMIRTRYLRLIAMLLSLSALVTLIVDFQFKVIIEQNYHNRDALAAFFGSFYAYVGFFSFLIQFFAGSRIFERYGLRVALLFLPMTLLGGTAALLAYPTLLWTGIFLKGSDGVIRGSIDKSTMEMLYVPVPQTVKVQVKAVIDMLIQRFSDGAGGVLLLVMTRVLGWGLLGVGAVNIVLLTVWIWTARATRREYQACVRRSPPTPQPTTEVRPEAA
jgi:ATP:ADP antiporter, AAA family